MSTAGTIDRQNSERGSVVTIMVVIMFLAVAGVTFMNSHNNPTTAQIAMARSKARGSALASRVHLNLKKIFSTYPAAGATCLPPEISQTRIKAFRIFNATSAAPIVASITPTAAGTVPAYSCLYDESDRDVINSLTIKITEMSQEPNTLNRNMNITVEVGLKRAKNTIEQTFRITRDYRMQVLSLSHFGLMFFGNPAPENSFVNIVGTALARIKTTTLFADEAPPAWKQVQPTNPEKVIYTRNVYSRFPKLQTTDVPDIGNFRRSFPYGIQTAVLTDNFAAGFLVDSSEAWNHRFDYFPLYNGVSYAIPEIAGETTTGSCVPDATPPADVTFSPSRADITRIPDLTGSGPNTLAQTCLPGARSPAFLFFRSDSDLTIDLDPSDPNFCGIVTANRLIINITSPSTVKYGLIGHFSVREIIIRSPATVPPGTVPMEVHFYNPEENEQPDGIQPLPSGQSLSNLAIAFKRLASASAWNFYVPISRLGTFRTRAPSGYMFDCPSGDYFAYQATYQPIHLLSGFQAYKEDNAGSIYTMEGL